MARKKIIAGNWKMNMTTSQAVELVNTLKDLVVNPDVDVVYCVPAIDIVPVVEDVYKRQAHGSLRLTLGADTTKEDIDYVVDETKAIVERLRSMSPLYEDFVKKSQQ